MRACTPSPGAWTTWQGERFKLGPVLPVESAESLPPGQLEVTKHAVRVGTATFALRRLEADCIRIAPLE